MATDSLEKTIKIIHREFEQNSHDEYTIIKCADRLNKLSQPKLAIKILEKTYNLPNHSNDYYRLCGDTFFELNELDSALKHYLMVSEKDNANPLLYNRLGNIYELKYDATYNKDYLLKSAEYFVQAYNLKPDRMFLKNLIIVVGKIGEATKHFELWQELLKNNPNKEDLWDYGCYLFKNGEFHQATEYFKDRFDKEDFPIPYPKFSKPLWDLKEDISDKTLLIHYEQGFGDTFMFCRFIENVKKYAKNVVFVAQDNLTKLLKYSDLGVEIISSKDFDYENYPYDLQVPLISLMKFWDFDNNALGKYLRVDDKEVQEFKSKLKGKIKIGISYYGTTGRSFRLRNVDLSAFKVLADIKDVQLYSFQMPDRLPAEHKALEQEFGIINLSEHLNDFYDTAVVLECMDIVVSADNVILNLSGALGKPTCAVLNNYTEYRWYKTEGEDIGWYKTVKPFTAEKMGDWKPVFERIKSYIVSRC